ncbi:sensor histidine kinase [Vibrio spartinae]|uniref:Sensor histidine kinase YpdA n=1 Tax=Vibrio spartinae TaxID=1918945 RepID=A0A1N6M5T7_9VIBR|nr:histidine kinase [Vibrio spartinae]SIO94750.1 Sensor histidine kinase YpdA [Vibrio spartinae]
MRPISRSDRSFRSQFLQTSLYCLAVSGLLMLFVPLEENSQEWWLLFHVKIIVSFGYGYSALFSGRLLKWRYPNLSEFKTNTIALICCLILGSTNAIYWSYPISYNEFIASLKVTVSLGFIFSLVCISFLYIHEQKLNAQNALEVSKRKQSEQKKTLALSQLKQLQSQIEPHFLFNTLANLDVLIDTDPRKAKQLLGHFTDLLRGGLKKYRKGVTYLSEELSLVDSYLAIQKIRLGDRLSYTVKSEISTSNFLIPPMLIQPLVENSIKHGIEPNSSHGNVNVYVLKKNNQIIIQVIDNGGSMHDSFNVGGNGVGLDNIRKRLQAIYQDKAEFSLKENRDRGMTAEIILPGNDEYLLNQEITYE